jgi:cytohesin
MLGAAQGWSDTLQFFLENHRPDLNARDKRGLTAMHYAAERSGSAPTTLAEAGAGTGHAAEDAVLLNNIAEVERYLANGGDVNVRSAHGSTLLHWAAACGHTEITDMLLQAGAAPNAPDNSGTTPLQLCFHQLYDAHYDIHKECARLLLEAGANPKVKIRGEWLIFAASRHATVLEQMLKNGISPDIRDSEGTPLLFHATSWKYANADSLKVLLAAGVDIFAKNPDGQDIFEADCVQAYEVFTLLDEERTKRTGKQKPE